MYIPKRLEVKGLMSHKHSVFTFNNSKATMIQGVNLTDEGQLSNGSGKSAILEGIAIAMLGNSLRKVSVKELIFRGDKHLTDTLELYNSVTKSTLVISRKLYSNTKSGELMITVDGKIPQELSVNSEDKVDVRQGNEWILNHIQISREDLLNYFLISKEKYVSFLSASDTSKKDVIGRFSQSNLLNPVYDVIQDEVDVISTQILDIDRKLVSARSKIDVYVEERDRFDLNALKIRQQKRIDEIVLKQRAFEDANKKYIESKKSPQAKLDIAETNLSQTPSIDVEERIEKVHLSTKEDRALLKELRDELDEIHQLKADVSKSIKGAVQCPDCGSEFSITDNSFDIIKAKNSEASFNQAILEVDREILDIKAKIAQSDDKIESIQKERSNRMSERRLIQKEIDQYTIELETIDRRINSNKQSLTDFEDQLKAARDYVIKDVASEYDDKIALLEKQIESDLTEQSQMEKDKFYKQEWKGVMTKFKTHLSNKAIGVIEAHCNEYLSRIKTNIAIKIDGYKINKSGDIRENITISILRDGLEDGSFDKLSSGEKTRIEISMILSLQKLINMNTEGGGLDLCFLDEVIESVDSDGIEGIMNTLNGLNQTIIAVTHGSFHKVYPNITYIEKVDGISIIK